MYAPQSRETEQGRIGTDPQRLLDVAVAVAEEAAAHVRSRRPEVFGSVGKGAASGNSVASKSTPTDPVTVVDTESERVIRDRLAILRPDDAILGEEGGGEGNSLAGVRWVVDPIDGTVNFLYGVPAYAVSVAAQIDGMSVAGAVVDVAARSTYSAARGCGATLTDAEGRVRELRCNPVTDVSMALLATGFGYSAARRRVQGALIGEILPRVRDIRRIGSAALDLCMVASGQVDAHFEHGLSPWDWAAGSLIATEAGARVRIPAPHSSSADGELVVAAAPGIADELEALFAEVGVDGPIQET
ncbi:inositol monophosphatase family protein [Rhodococcus marinonascens]|uniref:inositol monophosphatase family protein n=1 Tax=Rhodococcus marinonascens TaxID=38311 RepID=UPI002481E8AC|nr:inositol monophosphatase family protein [Rhodococcus marinonascens]